MTKICGCFLFCAFSPICPSRSIFTSNSCCYKIWHCTESWFYYHCFIASFSISWCILFSAIKKKLAVLQYKLPSQRSYLILIPALLCNPTILVFLSYFIVGNLEIQDGGFKMAAKEKTQFYDKFLVPFIS